MYETYELDAAGERKLKWYRFMSDRSRTQNSVRNVSFGLIVTVLNTLVSFISRTALVRTLGTEVLGLNGLFTEVITMLSLAEMGVGMAIVYSLYKPISEMDHKKISQLMSLYKSAYLTIAAVTFGLGIALTPFIDRLITDVSFPLSYVRLVFVLFVVKTSSSYLFSYKTSLLNADQKQYVVSTVSALVKLLATAVLIAVLVLFKNYILYLLLLIFQTLIADVILSRYVDKKYDFIDYHEKMPKDERKIVFGNIRDIFIKRVSGIITSSTDNILISTLVSTIQVGFYSNYQVIFNVVRTLKQQFTNGIAASIGNLSVTTDSGHCITVLKRLTYFYFVFAMIMSSGLMAVSRPFIVLWLGEGFVMENAIIYIAILNLFIEICCEPLWQYLEVSGLFRKDKNIAIIGSSVNIVVSIVLGLRIGITGIFLGTVCTQVIQLILKTRLIFKEKFLTSPGVYFKIWVKVFAAYGVLVISQILLMNRMTFGAAFWDFIIKGTLSVILAGILAILPFAKTDEEQYFFGFCKTAIKKLVGRK